MTLIIPLELKSRGYDLIQVAGTKAVSPSAMPSTASTSMASTECQGSEVENHHVEEVNYMDHLAFSYSIYKHRT